MEAVTVEERPFDEVRDGGEDVNDGMLEELVITGFITGHVVFPSSLNNIQLRVRRSERPICKVHSTMKFMIFPWKRLVPGTFLFTLK